MDMVSGGFARRNIPVIPESRIGASTCNSREPRNSLPTYWSGLSRGMAECGMPSHISTGLLFSKPCRLKRSTWALRIEADRMINSLFDEKEVASERTVVISEREGSENEPTFLLGEAVQNAAFRTHPYHHEIIGDLPDLKSMSRADLYSHYRTFYTPNNAILSVAGDFKTSEMLCQYQ